KKQKDTQKTYNTKFPNAPEPTTVACQ
ncbi:MAG: hypothetical protein QOD94_2524, partial [Alphaproteobacteria bacterium]|nr:hypothetical protein [Alphaproteobacteria bacterium]